MAGLDAERLVSRCDSAAGAYVHVPFCERICPFCPYDKVLADDELAARYFAALRAEIGAYVAAHVARFGPFTSLYVGGGTPTLYPDDLADVLARIPVTGERAVEVLPTHGTPERLDRLRNMGFTAVSIGAQSFHDGVLARLRRPHDARVARSAVEAAIGRFDCVDVDLIVDVAWDDDPALAGAFLADVEACFSLGVDQVSTYPLMRFGYTPFGTAQHDRRREHAVLHEVERVAAAMGYERRSVWTFHRLGATTYSSITRRRFLGMGASGSSFLGRDFLVNHFGVVTYAAAVESGRLPVARWLQLGALPGAAYDAFWQAYAGAVDVELLRESYGGRVAACGRAVLEPLRAIGFVRRSDSRYAVTARGFDAYHDLERLVTYELIEPLWAQLLLEHDAERSPARPLPAYWAAPERARRGRAWPLVSAAFERGRRHRPLLGRPPPRRTVARRGWGGRPSLPAPGWGAVAPWYEAAVGLVGWPEELEALVADVGGGWVLDVGCGPGYLGSVLAARGVTSVGVDVSHAMLQRASAGVARSAPLVVCGDVERLPFPDGAFDVVVSAGLLGLLAPPMRRRALVEMARVGRGDLRLIEPVHLRGRPRHAMASRVLALAPAGPLEERDFAAAGLDVVGGRRCWPAPTSWCGPGRRGRPHCGVDRTAC